MPKPLDLDALEAWPPLGADDDRVPRQVLVDLLAEHHALIERAEALREAVAMVVKEAHMDRWARDKLAAALAPEEARRTTKDQSAGPDFTDLADELERF